MAGVNCPRFGSRPLLQRSNSALGTPSTTSSTIVVGSPRETEAAPAWPFPNHGLLLRSPVPARQAFAHQPLVSSTRRRPVGISHPKLTEVLHRDYADCSALAKALSDQQKVESRVDNLLAAPANPALPATRRCAGERDRHDRWVEGRRHCLPGGPRSRVSPLRRSAAARIAFWCACLW